MTPSVSAPSSSFLAAPGDRYASLPATPTLRLLEVTCGLNRAQIESLLTDSNSGSARHRAHFPERPSELNLYQAFGVVLCGLLLSSIVAAVIVSLA